ncbi:hypothetical protein L1887_03524 [Cichorium endivia]|nr:hypothetical protein L1887_03524 [Cichorium endivia]
MILALCHRRSSKMGRDQGKSPETEDRLPKVAGKACLGDVIEFQRRKTIDARILISYGGAEEVLDDSILPWIHIRSGYLFHGFLEFYLCQIEQKEAVLDPIIFLNIQSQIGHSTTGFVNSADGFLNGELKEITRSCMVVLVLLMKECGGGGDRTVIGGGRVDKSRCRMAWWE